MRRLTWHLFLVLLFLSTDALASPLCDYYRSNAPTLYRMVCSSGGGGGGRPAGASSSFSSAFNLTAASLPSEPSSYGLETLGNYARSSGETGPIFSIVKGFKKFGTGISTSSNNTFYGDDVVQRSLGEPDVSSFTPHEAQKGSIPNLNLGTAISLFKLGSGVAVKLGTSLRYNKTTATFGGGPALSFSSPYLTIGGAVTRERISNFLGPITFSSFQFSVRLSVLEFEFNQLMNNSVLHQNPIRIYTLSASIKKFIFTIAQRSLDYQLNGENFPVTQRHFAAQYLISKTFAGGFMYNYIPGATTLGLQIYL